jgi:hypothetical protein
MSSVLGEEPVHYHATSSGVEEMSLSKAEAGMDWEAYDRQSEIDLREAVAEYQAGGRGMPAKAFFDELEAAGA